MTPEQLLLIAQAKRKRAEAGGEAKPDPNASNPIITAQRQSQVKAGNDFAKKKDAERRYQDELAVMNASSPIPFKNTGPDGPLELNQERPDRFAGRATGAFVNSNINVANTLGQLGLSTANAFGAAGDPSMQGALAGGEYGDITQRVADAAQRGGYVQNQKAVRDILPSLPIPAATTPGEMAADVTGNLASVFTGFGAPILKGGKVLSESLATVPGMSRVLRGVGVETGENAALAYGLSAGAAPAGSDRNMAGTRGAADPINYVSIEAARAVPRAIKGLDNALKPAATPTNAGGVAPRATRPQSSVAPITPAAQAGPASTGQQANASPPPVGRQTLNATAQAAPQNVVALAKSDARNLRNLMRAAGVPRNDVDALLIGMVQDFNRVNDPRMRLAFFAAEYLPQKLPKPVADAVLAQFDAFGFQQLTDSGPGAGVMKSSIDEVRDTQKPYLEGEFDAAFGKQDLITTKGKVRKLKADNADAIYKTQIGRQQDLIAKGSAPPEQIAARDELLSLMAGEDFYKRIPEELAFRSRNEGFGALSDYVKSRPLESAHWLQSRLGELARKGGDNAGMYREMRTALLKQIEEAVPGYRGARRQHGDAIGQELAVTFGKEVRAAAGDRLKIAELAEEYRALPKSQQSVARLAMKEALTNEFRKLKGAARVDPATGNAIDPQQVMITQLQKDGMMDALETIFGKPGERATTAIRKVMRENEGLPKYRSDTAPNIKKQEGAVEAVRSPANKLMRGVSDKTGYSFTVPADIVGAAMGVPPVFTASKVAGDVGSFLSKPNPKKMASTANVLYGMKPAGGIPPAGPVRNKLAGPSGRSKTKAPPPPPSQDALADLRRQYDLVDPGANPREAERIRKAILRMENDLSGASALPAPQRPPVNRLGMSGSPEAIGAAGGTVFAPDADGDGEVSFGERAGAAITGGVIGRGVRGGMNALAPRGPDQAGLFGRPKATPAFDQRFMKEAQQLVSYNGGVKPAVKAQQYVIDQLVKNNASQDRINRAVSIRSAIERMAERSNRELDEIAARGSNREPPEQSGFGSSPKPPPKKAEEVALINALKKARATETATRRRNVMRDNRDELNSVAEEAVMQAERDLLEYRDRQFRQAAQGARWMDRGAAVANVGKKAAVATGNQIKKTMMKNDAELLKTYGVAVGGIGAVALGARALAGPDDGKDEKREAIAPTDKRYFVETKLKKNPEMLRPVQDALVELELLDILDADTKWGAKTRDAIDAYLSQKPDRLPIPLQDYEVPALLAEAYGGYQENGKWFYNTGEPIVYPPKRSDTYLPARPLRPDEARRMTYDKRTEAQRNKLLGP
jgi:hypothetical protein